MTLTDAEKTLLLAEGCMGWEHLDGIKAAMWDAKWISSNGAIVCNVSHWQPLHNESHAADVRERMRELGYNCLQLQSIAGVNLCDFFSDATTSLQPKHVCKTPAIAICHAALLALGLAKEEEL